MTAPVIYPLQGKRIYVAGHNGMVGSAICARLANMDCEVLTVDRQTLDLTRQADTEDWLSDAKPDAIFIAAAMVGGILSNATYPADFITTNLAIQTNVIAAAHRIGVEKLMMLGSSCIYPREAPQPMPETALLTGPLEKTNEAYAIAKIAGVIQAQSYRDQYGADYISVMPTNLYGPRDNFDLETSHVLPALIAKAHAAKEASTGAMELWGTGTPRREFLYVKDLADALVFVMERYSAREPLNIGSGSDIAIKDLADIVAKVIGFEGGFTFDASKPDGMMQKWMDSSRVLGLGWAPTTAMEDGIAETYAWYKEHLAA